jgi:hypothetical protein
MEDERDETEQTRRDDDRVIQIRQGFFFIFFFSLERAACGRAGNEGRGFEFKIFKRRCAEPSSQAIHSCGALTAFQMEDVNTKISRRPVRVAGAKWRSSPRLDGS